MKEKVKSQKILLRAIFFSLFFNLTLIQAHDNGEHLVKKEPLLNYGNWIQQLGKFHLIFLHFPIALIIMTAIAELLSLKIRSSIFSQAARFMIIAAAITAVPTAILGLAYSYNVTYEPPLNYFLWWHRFLGISTAILAIITAILKELSVRGKIKRKAYVVSLILLVICITITGYLGGEMTFGFFT